MVTGLFKAIFSPSQEASFKNKETKNNVKELKDSNENDSLLDMLAATPQWDSMEVSSVEESTNSRSSTRGKWMISDLNIDVASSKSPHRF